jgi:flagellar L-ring protein precursor FlgH
MTAVANIIAKGAARRSLRQRLTATVTLAALSLGLTACAGVDRLKSIGEQPALAKITDPTQAPGYKPVSMPVPNDELPQTAKGSIWQPGARAFFKDHRASRVGDLVTVQIAINDQAKLNNQTQGTRNDATTSAGTNMLGLEKVLPNWLNATSLVNTSGTLATDGQAQINRSEQVDTTIAALVTQVLPTGNLVIVGRQEMRVNYDIRDVQISGIIRPTDIDPTNTITYDKIADARISYGGQGQGMDLQQPRYGTQLMDIVSPF